MGNALKWVMLVAILYIGIMAFFSTNDIVQQTQPTDNNTTLGKMSLQNNQMIDLSGALLPGILILAGAWVALKVFTDG